MEDVVAAGQEALLHHVRLDAHLVALTLDVHLHAVQQVVSGQRCLPGSESHHRLLVRLQAADSAVIESQVLLRPQHADYDGGVTGGDGLGSGDANQHLRRREVRVLCSSNVSQVKSCINRLELSDFTQTTKKH